MSLFVLSTVRGHRGAPSKGGLGEAASKLTGYSSLGDAQYAHPSCLEVNFCDLRQKSQFQGGLHVHVLSMSCSRTLTDSSFVLLVCM